MGNLISFMKEVAEGLRKSGNYGTAHVYRSSMNAIIAFNGSRNLSFKKVNQEFLKSFETYLREKDCSWNTARLTVVWHLIYRIISGMFIQERVLTESVHWKRRIWND